MILPSYGSHSFIARKKELDEMLECSTVNELCNRIYSCDIEDFMRSDFVQHYLKGASFRTDADYFASEELINGLLLLLRKIHQAAVTFGFPGQPLTRQASKIDILLSKILWETLEETGFTVTPSQVNSRLFQQFATQRLFPLITFWRWKIVTSSHLSSERIISSPRNYFYVLWISGYLFDKGSEFQNDRWTFLESMSSDSLVQIIERSGIGYRKGFAQAIAAERIKRSESASGGVLDKLVRGCMKRASFTFATSVMAEDYSYYNKIAEYLFHWAEINYITDEDSQKK